MFSLKSIPVSRKLVLTILLACSVIGTFILGLTFRYLVLQAQMAAIGPDMPFTLESALHYRRVKMMHDRGKLPEIDEAIQYPEGIKISEIDSISSEPVQANLAKLFPSSVPFPDRIRWIESGWFCLTIPLLVLMMRYWTGSWVSGFITGILYAISMSSVIRSTGQEISRENFAFPFMAGFYLFAARYFHSPDGVFRNRWALCAGLFFSLALIAWDMTQFMVGVFALGFSFHVLVRGTRLNRKYAVFFMYITGAVILTGLIHPYYRFHGLAFSPLVLWMISALAVSGYFFYRHAVTPSESAGRCARFVQRWVFPVLILMGPVAILLAAGVFSAYGASYEHFAELMVAKIRFLNVKPTDPSLMTYYQRIMWVPSLHSATWVLTKWYFPLTVWVSGIIALVASITSFKRPDPLISHWTLLFGISVAAFVLFVRFHVFVGLSSAVLAGWAYGRIKDSAIGWRASLIFILALVMMAEGGHTLRQRHSMGRPNVYYPELRELSEWLLREVAPDPILANMGVSAYIAAYGKCAIVIHPKFEDPIIRAKLEHYGELLFGADEKALRDWMDELGVSYFVYSKGEFAAEKPEYQMRYFVNKMDPPESVAARRFEREDETLRYFKRLWGNRKYVVYRTFSRQDEETAALKADGAMELFYQGNLDRAEKLAIEALEMDIMQEKALQVMKHVGSLRDQGFNTNRELPAR